MQQKNSLVAGQKLRISNCLRACDNGAYNDTLGKEAAPGCQKRRARGQHILQKLREVR